MSTAANKQRITYSVGMLFGCDPEFFFRSKKTGRIVGSEKVLPEKGLPVTSIDSYSKREQAYGTNRFVMDGIQAELNVDAFSCRAGFSSTLATSFKALKRHLDKREKQPVNVVFAPVVGRVTELHLSSLSEKSRILGCAPSLNVYEKHDINVDPVKYRYRSLGGHIHMGISSYPYLMANCPQFVEVLDATLGNISVLVDRDTTAKNRRKLYGRAGEYRTPKHGLEYRTLSPFWLRSYQLMSMTFGLARLAAQIANCNAASMPSATRWDAAAELLKLIPVKERQQAINMCDTDVAWANWEIVKKFLLEHMDPSNSMAIYPAVFKQFEQFLRDIESKGIEKIFPDDAFTFWTRPNYQGGGNGFESWISGYVGV